MYCIGQLDGQADCQTEENQARKAEIELIRSQIGIFDEIREGKSCEAGGAILAKLLKDRDESQAHMEADAKQTAQTAASSRSPCSEAVEAYREEAAELEHQQELEQLKRIENYVHYQDSAGLLPIDTPASMRRTTMQIQADSRCCALLCPGLVVSRLSSISLSSLSSLARPLLSYSLFSRC